MALATSRFTQALLDLEDDEPDVLFETFPGADVPLWPQVRMNLSLAMSESEFTSVAVASGGSTLRDLRRAALSFLPSRNDAARIRQSRDIAFFTSGVTTTPTPRGERNWLIGDFAQAFPDDSAILQWRGVGPGWHSTFPLTTTLDPIRARAEVRTRLRPPAAHDDRVRLLIREFATRLGARIDDQRLEAITASAIYGARVSGEIVREIDGILDRLRPRVVMFDSPVDGGWGAVIAAMKRREIHVAEPQHGWIGPSHGAYNFGAAMRRAELAAELPDELLTFGSYWSDGLRYVGSVTPIGKPQFESAVELAPPVEERPREILVVSSVGDPERTSDFVLALAAAMPPGWTVALRPHPTERPTRAQRYSRLIGVPGVTFDERDDVYSSLAAARIVIGVASTVLFEAAGMGCRVFVRDTPYVPYIVGDLFGEPLRGPEGIARVIAESRSPGAKSPVDRSALWKPDAVENYRRWVEKHRSTKA